MFIDTHAHLYDEQFDADRSQIIQKAIDEKVGKILLPNCNLASIEPMMELVENWPEICLPMMGLHPCYVQADFKQALDKMHQLLDSGSFVAVGEIGLDYHWDTTFVSEQKTAFEEQIGWALKKNLPIVIHSRKSLRDCIDIVKSAQNGVLKGVFHCFSGSLAEAKEIVDLGFFLGIGGVATFKNGGLNEVIEEIPLSALILETDAPYLAPTPYRGKRNESGYIPLIAAKVAEIKQCKLEEVAAQTTANSIQLFKLNKL